MRIELEFELAQPVINKDYRRIILSWLKYALTDCNHGKYYDKYFEGAYPKDYSFTVIFPSPKFSKDCIYFKEPQIKIVFSTDHRGKTGLIFYSAFLEKKNRKFPLSEGNIMVLKKVSQRSEHLITESDVFFRTCLGNGLCIREHNRETNRDRFVTYLDADFREKALEVLKVQARLAGYPKAQLEDLDIEPMQCKKVLVYHYQIYVDTTVGIFQMHGDPDILQYFYEAGMGGKRSGGFGMMDILKQGVL